MQPADVPIRKLEKYYSNYKQEHQQRKIETFFYEHKNEEWFLEKYCPLLKAQLAVKFTQQTRDSFKAFCNDLGNGQFKNLSLEISEQLVDRFSQQNGTRLNFHGQVDLPEKLHITESPFHGFDPNSLTLFIKAVPKNISRQSLLDIFEKLEGFVSLSLSDPLRSHDFVRYGWAAFRTESACVEGFLRAQSFLQEELSLCLMRSKTAKRFFKVVPEFSMTDLKDYLVLSAELIRLLDFVHGIDSNPLLPSKAMQKDWHSCSDSTEMLRCIDMQLLLTTVTITPLQQLDLQISYLRKVHYFCFFSVTQFNDERKLSAKSGCAFLRSKLDFDKFYSGYLTDVKIKQKYVTESHFQDVFKRENLLSMVSQNIKRQTILNDWAFKIKVLLAKYMSTLTESIL